MFNSSNDGASIYYRGMISKLWESYHADWYRDELIEDISYFIKEGMRRECQAMYYNRRKLK